MYKTFWKLLSLLLLLIVSFIYTNKVFTEAKNTNPVMKKINEFKKDNYTIAIEPIINGDELILGLSGLKVNTQNSYNNMKEEKKFNEDKIVYDKYYPKCSINNNYDYYIVGGNPKNKNIAIIIKIYKDDDIKNIDNIINKNNIKLNLFVDGIWIEKNKNNINNKTYEINNFGYNDKKDINSTRITNNLIEDITLKKPIFCLNEEKDDAYKKICSKFKMYSIKPSIINPNIIDIKKNIKNGSIISYDIKTINESNFISAINFIKQKGYNIVYLSKLIQE